MRQVALGRSVFVAVAATLMLLPAPASPQLGPLTPEGRAAGLRVTAVAFEPEELVVSRGDTVELEVTPLDGDGNPVEDARVGLSSIEGRVAPLFRVLEGGSVVRFVGEVPGTGELLVGVYVPEDRVDRYGVPGRALMAPLPLRVLDWPAVEVEADPPTYAAYAGTAQQLSGRVITDRGTESTTAEMVWRSSDPSIATVTTDGFLTALRPGTVTVTASTQGDLTSDLSLTVDPNPVRSLAIAPAVAQARTGDVLFFEATALDAGGREIVDAAIELSVTGRDGTAGFVFGDGTFVAEQPGVYRVIASAGGVSAAAGVEVLPRDAASSVELVAKGVRAEVDTSDLWVFEGRDGRDYAYTGTHARGGGERMFVWDVTDPRDAILVDSVVVDARIVNDVKVNEDASWAIITREGSSDRRNGIVVLDLADPAHPTVMSELTDSLTGGIHNVWIMGEVVYAVNDGTGAMSIVDMSDPAAPRYAGRWDARPGEDSQTLHDVWARDGYAYLSYFADGMIILDVGAGTHGGSAFEPALVSSIKFPQDAAHTAWREGDYVFVGDEIMTEDGMRGFVHVVDVSDIDDPREVAKYEVPEAGAHNIWVEDGILYIAYYQGGVRLVDVTGTLRGDLYRQGREIGYFRTAAPPGEAIQPNEAQAWGPQVHKDHLFVSDMYSGLWILHREAPDGAPVF